MFSLEELRDIAKINDSGTGFVSLYLNVNPITNPRGEYVIWLKNAIKELQGVEDKDLLKSAEKDLQEIESYVQKNRRSFKKGLSILSSSERSFWREYNLEVPLKSELVLDKSPFIKPLLDILEHYQRYAVLLVDKEQARIFVIHLGQITEYGEVRTEDVPGRHKMGGWFALAQTHFERHIDYHIGLHLKDVIKHFEPFLKSEDINRLIMGGPEEAVLRTRDLLPKPVAEKVIGTFNAGMFEGTLDVLKKAEPLLRQYERAQEAEIVSELTVRAKKGDRAVLGLEKVLEAVQAGSVHRLVLERDATAMGFTCTDCGLLSLSDNKVCSYCGGNTEGINYIIDLATQRAVEQNAEVLVVPESEELRREGSIGAFLRF